MHLDVNSQGVRDLSTSPATSATTQSPSFLVESAFRRGWQMADEAIRRLEERGILPPAKKRQKNQTLVAPEILMEISAILRLTSWMEGGLCGLLKNEQISRLFAALDVSENRLTADPNAFADLQDLPPLTQDVFDLWEKHLSWSGIEELNADVVLDLSASDEEQQLNELADFLYEHRHAGLRQNGS
jgi:hypothetical protein